MRIACMQGTRCNCSRFLNVSNVVSCLSRLCLSILYTITNITSLNPHNALASKMHPGSPSERTILVILFLRGSWFGVCFIQSEKALAAS